MGGVGGVGVGGVGVGGYGSDVPDWFAQLLASTSAAAAADAATNNANAANANANANASGEGVRGGGRSAFSSENPTDVVACQRYQQPDQPKTQPQQPQS
jgi:hypothetical protein